MNEDYQDHLQKMIVDYRTFAITGKLPELHEVTASLDLNEDNRLIRDLCVELKIASKREFDTALYREQIRRELGKAPNNATELMEAYAATHSIEVRFDGKMKRKVKPTIGDTDQPITEQQRRDDECLDRWATFMCDAKGKMNRLVLERELRILSANYRLFITAADIADAVEAWLDEAYRRRLHDIYMEIESSVWTAQDRWSEVAEKVFDCSATSPEFVAAILKKFCWQVKRKMRGLPVTNHLMPVILGPQGIGKSTFVNQLLSPVDELCLGVDFQMVTDERNVEIWRSYVMFLDEMGYASKADIDTVKNIITASTLTRRPMRSNGKVTIDQNATLIGCSNRELAQLVRDPTGIRRFAAIRMRSDAPRDFINGLDWKLLWGAVNATGADPLSQFTALLSEQQEESRERSRVEQWMFDCDGREFEHCERISTTELYRDFRHYEDEMYPSFRKTDKVEWDHEINRLLKNQPEALKFEKKRANTGVFWRWCGAPLLKAVK